MTARIGRALLITVAGVLPGCDGDPNGPTYDPDIPAAWAAVVDNTFFPLIPGTRWEYEGETDEGTETVVVEVLDETRSINGVVATIVRDRVFLEGDLTEDTFDWFAQDAAGNVWYLGEASKEIEDGEVVSTEGSWEWGEDGALPGIIMWADPAAHVGEEYRQEFFEGEAEDWGKVVALNEQVVVPFGTITGCIRTEDWNALEGGGREHKFYCPALGLALETAADDPEERVELVARNAP